MNRRVRFTVTHKERALIEAIVARAAVEDAQRLEMDLAATHANGCPIDFQRLLDAPHFDFWHDIRGIERHLDRRTGRLRKFFEPRCALRKVA